MAGYVRALSLIGLICLLSACIPVREYQQPTAPEGSEIVALESESEQFSAAEPVAQWWYRFTDPELHQIMDDALAHNKDIEQALARLEEAQALTTAQRFDYLPTITASGAATRRRFNAAGIGGNGPQIFELVNADLAGSWEADFLGRVSQRVEAQSAARDARAADAALTQVIVSADVATAYAQLRLVQQRLAIAERNADTQARTLELTKALFEAGRGTQLDVARAENLLATTRASIAPLQAEETIAIRRLSVLSGALPDTLQAQLSPLRPMPSLPATIKVGNVESLLIRRPDIRAAERQLAAATAQYNVTATELFPTLSLNGSIGYLASSLSQFGTSASLVGFIAPTLNWRALDMGRVLQEVDAADANARASLAAYEGTVLAALEETQNALTQFHRFEQQRAQLEEAAKAAEKAATIAQIRFDYGTTDFLSVLDAQRTQLQAEDALVRGNGESLLALIRIYRALGGGWQEAEPHEAGNPPTPPEPTDSSPPVKTL